MRLGTGAGSNSSGTSTSTRRRSAKRIFWISRYFCRNSISSLSGTSCRVLEQSTRQEVPLSEEMEFLQKYLEIQKMRFAERLRVEVDVPDELLPAPVPSLILQPMVENALKHGIAKRV